jgi:predicted nucleotidyltransferase
LLDLIREATQNLIERLGEKIVAVALFGSIARNEAIEVSDIDIFVVVTQMPTGLERRFLIYDTLHKTLKRDITIIDMDEKEIFREDLEITPMLLNIAWDSKVIYDPSGKLCKLFDRIKEVIKKLKLERYQTSDGKYGWKPAVPGPLKSVEV